MIDGGAAAFLQQAHRNNWQQYLSSLRPGARHGWDLCILTAGDERQASMYRRQLDWRREAGLLPVRTQFLVLSDPDGRRIGSGGATLRALQRVSAFERLNVERANVNRIFIIHSGGDSRRLPHCSAIGKLFARVPRELPDGRASTIFDEFLISLSGLEEGSPPGVLIAAGDVLLVFDHLQLRGAFRRSGVIGVAAAAPAELGTHHSVYASGGEGGRAVHAYLHKHTLAELAQASAISSDGTVQIDTGLVWLDAPTVGKLVGLAQALATSGAISDGSNVPTFERLNVNQSNVPASLNLYGDLLLPLAASTTFDSYLSDASDGPATPEVQAARRIIWERLRGIPFAVERLQPASFAHFGTSQEYWRMAAGDPDLARLCGWSLPDRVETGPVLINAVVENPPTSSRTETEIAPALVIDSHLAGPVATHGAAIIANVETSQPLALGRDVVLHQLPVPQGYVTRLFGLRDDPKLASIAAGATLLNQPWADWLAGDDELIAALWPDLDAAERTLWNARLFPASADREQSLELALPLQDPSHAPAGWRVRWLGALRLSLAESFRQADGERILVETAAIEDLVAAQHCHRAIQAEQSASEVKALLNKIPGAAGRRVQLVSQWLAHADPILQLRGFAALAAATGDGAWEDRAFTTLAEMVEGSKLKVTGSPLRPSTVNRQPVRVHAAARIDFGGGWTDTPPYSIERGGTVLNAAITLRGGYPILTEAQALAEPGLVLDSRDIEAMLEPATVGDVSAYANPADPFALLKAALVLRGVVPQDEDPARPLADLFRELGCGLRLSTQTLIPRGSGLGTSSIMAGAVLAALARWAGVELPQVQLFDEVLCLEQMLTTGGGWQDQVGGLTGGIKLVTTGPGLPQAIHITPVALSPKTANGLAERLLLVYTGQQRLAKNLLRNVMIRWMARDPEMVWIQGELARLALAMQQALTTDDLAGFGRLLAEHWVLNKRMDPGCTNPFIDDLFAVMEPFIWGGKLAGAGGGGYAMVITRDEQAGRDLAAALAERYPGTPVAVWPCAIPNDGLQVDTLER
jgi:fucokinase